MSFGYPNESPLARALREAMEAENRRKSLLGGGISFPQGLGSLYPSLLGGTVKRKVFISYHHENDQQWANYMKSTYADKYEIFYDNSLDEEVDSDDPEYINRVIREEFINGSSITIVLCGAETGKRRFVDWEIYSTLHHDHALLGIALPTATKSLDGKVFVPARLHDNIVSGYAHWIAWTTDGTQIQKAVETAIAMSSKTGLIENGREKMQRSSP